MGDSPGSRLSHELELEREGTACRVGRQLPSVGPKERRVLETIRGR